MIFIYLVVAITIIAGMIVIPIYGLATFSYLITLIIFMIGAFFIPIYHLLEKLETSHVLEKIINIILAVCITQALLALILPWFLESSDIFVIYMSDLLPITQIPAIAGVARGWRIYVFKPRK